MKRLLLITLFLYLSNILFAQLPTIEKLEYYIDTDPGYGLATSVSLSPSNDIDINFNIDVSSVSTGIHHLFIRGKDVNDIWSFSKSHTFYKGFYISDQPISIVEYFFGTDPGYGNAMSFEINSSTDVEIITNLDVSSLENGIHNLFVRAQDQTGQWTNIKSHTFYKGIFSTGIPANIKTVEYYINTDPGLGNGNKVTIIPGSELDLTFDVDLTGHEGELVELFIRAQDENESWSLIQKHAVSVNATGTSEFNTSNFQLFPNPSTGDFTIQLDGGNKKKTVKIMRINGQVVFEKSYNSENVIDNITLHEAPGLYLVKVFSGDKINVKKLTIERR